jgi:apolipoprotein N-acyltransferase
MFRHPIFATWFVSIYLLVYTILLATGSWTLWAIAEVMLPLSPVLVLWLAYSVIRYGQFDGRELKEGEEFGYSDRP